MTPEKDIEKAEKENKYRYLQECLGCRCHFTPLFFSSDRIPVKEAWSATLKMASHLSFKIKTKRGYSEMCGFVWARMALAVV